MSKDIKYHKCARNILKIHWHTIKNPLLPITFYNVKQALKQHKQIFISPVSSKDMNVIAGLLYKLIIRTKPNEKLDEDN